MAQNRREPTFQVIDLVRAAAILPVLASHAGPSFTAGPGFESILWNWVGKNNLYGVTVFFVVSGFLITRVLAKGPGGLYRPDLRHFYVRRVGRIFPLLFLFVGIGLAILWYGQAMGGHLPARFRGVWLWAGIATFTFNWYEVAVNSSWFGLHWMVLWSLAVEEQFYVLYPLVLRHLGKPRDLVLFLMGVLCVGPIFRFWAYQVHPENYWLESISTFSAVDQLAVGCLLFIAWERYRDVLGKSPVMRRSLMLAGLVSWFLLYTGTSIYDAADLVWAPTLVALSCACFLLGGLSSDRFEAPWVRAWTLPGRYSYGMYLLHTTVLFLGYSWFVSKPVFWAFPLYLVLCTAIAGLSFHFYEFPVNHWIRRRWDPSYPDPGTRRFH